MAQAAVPLAFRQHDHADCVKRAMHEAQRLCRESGARLTPLRRRVLELLWSTHRPVGAYELLELLVRETPERRRATPASIYRALDFLLRRGLVHRIECRNAYIGCVSPARPHHSQFFICSNCARTLEITSHGIDSAINHAASEARFALSNSTVEVAGICPTCRGRNI